MSLFLRISELNQRFTSTRDERRAHGSSAIWLPASYSCTLSSQKRFCKAATLAKHRWCQNSGSKLSTICSQHSLSTPKDCHPDFPWQPLLCTSVGTCSILHLHQLGRRQSQMATLILGCRMKMLIILLKPTSKY